jgi:hypothetical protein
MNIFRNFVFHKTILKRMTSIEVYAIIDDTNDEEYTFYFCFWCESEKILFLDSRCDYLSTKQISWIDNKKCHDFEKNIRCESFARNEKNIFEFDEHFFEWWKKEKHNRIYKMNKRVEWWCFANRKKCFRQCEWWCSSFWVFYEVARFVLSKNWKEKLF